MRALVLLAAIVIAGCRDRPYSIADLRIDGASEASEATLREAASDCPTAEHCAAFLQSWYFDHGFLDARVEPTKTWLQSFTGRYSSLTVNEGPRYTLTGVEIVEFGKTDALADPASLTALSVMQEGGPFSQQAVADTILALQRRYTTGGFSHILITPITSVDPDLHTITVRLEIERSP